MAHFETHPKDKALPKPVQLTPEEVQQVAAGTAAGLPQCPKPPIVLGFKAY